MANSLTSGQPELSGGCVKHDMLEREQVALDTSAKPEKLQ